MINQVFEIQHTDNQPYSWSSKKICWYMHWPKSILLLCERFWAGTIFTWLIVTKSPGRDRAVFILQTDSVACFVVYITFCTFCTFYSANRLSSLFCHVTSPFSSESLPGSLFIITSKHFLFIITSTRKSGMQRLQYISLNNWAAPSSSLTSL